MSETAPAQNDLARILQRRRWSRVARGACWLAAIVSIAFIAVAVLVVVQGMYGEVRRADAILVLPGSCAPVSDAQGAPCATQQLDYALDLYRRYDYTTHLALIGQGAVDPGRAYLVAKGVPDGSLLLGDQETVRRLQLRQITQLARERGVSSMLIVGAPTEMLVALKMTRDLGLAAYAAPLPGRSAFDLLAVARETVAYWQYVLFSA